jgi:hypothetical protein
MKEQARAQLSLGWAGHIVTMGAALLALLGASCAYTKTQKDRLADESYARREERYQNLVATVPAFRAGHRDCAGRNAFLQELNQCWLYCSDEAIRAAKRFLDMTKSGRPETDEPRAAAIGEFMLIVRKDLLSRKAISQNTTLRADDYELLYVRDCDEEGSRNPHASADGA